MKKAKIFQGTFFLFPALVFSFWTVEAAELKVSSSFENMGEVLATNNKWGFKKGKSKWGVPKKKTDYDLENILQKAEGNYGMYCAACHGTEGDGKGAVAGDDLETEPRDHTDAEIMSERTDEDIFRVINEGGDYLGLSDSMPPHKGLIPEKEIRGLVKYIRKLCKCEYQKN